MSTLLAGEFALSVEQFAAIRDRLYAICGINLQPGKEGLVRSRLARRIRALELEGFDAYLAHLDGPAGAAEIREMVEALTTNKTSFFREAQHFDYLAEQVLPAHDRPRGALRIWSAGCSSGEEPYTIAMVLRDRCTHIDTMDVKILATDIAARVLVRAREGEYPAELAADVPPAIAARHLVPRRGPAGRTVRVADPVRRLVQVSRLNLMDRWPMRGPFDVIFCRNVMIYFDKATQQRLVARFTELLAPGGHLFVGHSESLSAIAHGLRYVQPAVYRR